MKWFVQAPLELLVTVIAYILNPVIMLFCDEYGWLPHWLYWFQTYDNCLYVDWMIYEHCVPSWAEYDFNKHYKYHLEQKFDDGRVIAGYVDMLDKNFTLKEKLQRYVCGLCWLYRNCNYGFSYYVNGRSIDSTKLVIKEDHCYINDEIFIGWESSKSLWRTTWCLFYCKKYCKWFRLRIYLGWKLKSKSSGRHMLALHISPFKPVEN